MIEISIPGYREFRFEHLVLDYNGTLACDGELLVGVGMRLNELARNLRVHVLTADTFGKARAGLAGIHCELSILAAGNEAESKRAYVEKLGAQQNVCIGNGRNDRLMLEAATLAVAVLGAEGTATETITAAHVVTPDIIAALDLLTHPLRLTATLRS